ncbi:hypothetical protein [uncultured Brevundimonas sp.]|uniref:hypothetical protein n=1 Tax=uncultured Brevundimonas sp. TaxID=213418 RepID=UPI002618BAD6|nr:hypothetical protein [uncultured Brevundimonas sp.]
MTHSAPHWIVLPPSLLESAWRSALKQEAARTGVVVCEFGVDKAPDGSGIVLIDDLDVAQSAGASDNNLTVIALPPFIDLDGCATASEIHARVEAVSRRIAAAYAFPGHAVRDLTGKIDVPALPYFSSSSVGSPGVRKVTAQEASLRQAANVFLDGRAHWSSGVFTYDDRNAATAPQSGRLDVTGRPRFLMSGPHMSLPAGVWQAKVSLAFDHEVSNRRFRIDWGGMEAFTTWEFSPGRSGVFDITLTFSWDEPGPAELRLLVLEGVFHGSVVFGGAVISRISDPESASQDGGGAEERKSVA